MADILGSDERFALRDSISDAGVAHGAASNLAHLLSPSSGPTAPSHLAAPEGPILTILEAADGTQITGQTDAGSTVTVTFVNGATQLVKQASVTGTNFTVSLTAAEINALGDGYIKYSAVASAGGTDSAPSPTSQLFFTHQPIVDTLTRLDSGGSLAALAAESSIGVSPLQGGGFAVRWAVDGNGDGKADGLAVQRYAADGVKQGGPTILQGLSSTLLAHSDNVGAFDLAALQGGGYALSYSVEQQRFSHSVTISGLPSGGGQGVQVVGRPTVITIGNAPPGASFALNGVALTVQNGTITITQAILDQIGVQDRTFLQVSGVAQGQTATFLIQSAQDAAYDPASALHDVIRTVNVNSAAGATSGGATLGLPTTGRAESFHIDTATFAAGANHTYLLLINTIVDSHSIYLGNTPNATLSPTGQIQVSVTPDANGNIAVPQSILSQIGTNDASIFLFVGGLQPGTAVNATLAARDAISQPEGVFVQHFGADGVSLGDPGARIDTSGAGAAFGTDSVLADTALGVTPLDGGGYAVRWVTDSNGDGDPDGLAVQRYGADGVKQGGVTVLQGLSDTLVSHGDNLRSFDLVALGNGGYALSYALTQQSFSHGVTLMSGGGTLLVPIVGRPTSITVGYAPAGTSFALEGTGNGGTQVTIPLTVQDGKIVITQAILDQLGIDNRMTLTMNGVPQGSSVGLSINVLEDVTYDSSGATHSVSRSSIAGGAQGAASGSAGLSVPNARADSFHIDSATFAAGATHTYLLVINPIQGGNALQVGGIPGASVSTSGQIQITVTPDGNGNIFVPPQILSQIGDDDAQVYLVVLGLQIGSTLSGTVAVHDAIAVPSGVFVQTFGSNGVALTDGNTAISGAAFTPAPDAERGVGVTPLDGGGFVVRWAVDTDGDGNGDNLAVQRYGADGAKQGGVTMLQGISSNLTDHGGHAGSVDFAALANGGYALSYAMELEQFGHFATVTAGAANQTLAIPIVGRPTTLGIVGDTPPNAVFTLSGTGNGGSQISVPVTVQNGTIIITQAILDQFGLDDRMTLLVTGLTAGQSAGVSVLTVEDVTYDPTAALHDISRSWVATQGANQGIAFLGNPTGRAEAFHIDSATFAAGATHSYMLVINPIQGGALFYTSFGGIPGATLNSNGQIQIPVTPDANGNILVPQSLLDQFGVHDAGIYLAVSGLQVGSTLNGIVSVHDPIHQPEGVFVQTFGADGIAISGDLHLVGGGTDDVLLGAAGNDVITGLGGHDVLIGAAGDDNLDGGAGIDYLYGGTGNDIFHTDDAADLVFENAGEGTDTVITTAGYYLYANIENLTLAPGAGDIFGVGNELANIIAGNEGSNLLIAGAGDDTVHGGAGVDSLFGQDGNDHLFGDAGIDYLVGGNGDDVLDGGTEADALYGEDGNDTLIGGSDFQTDILVGGNGNDVLHGDSGLGDYDLMDGGAGDDTYYVDTPADLTFEAVAGGTDTVYANINGAGYYLYANVENLVLLGTTPYGVGNELDNHLTGNASANYLLGGGGNDVLNGKAGNDVLFGESGADTFVFEHGTGGDVIGDFVAGTDKIDLTAFGFANFDTLVNSMHEVNGTTAIDLGGGDFIVLNGVAEASLHAGDFILGGGTASVIAAALAIETHSQLHLPSDGERSNHLASMPALVHIGDMFL
jgi:Ca2+-binding RTX toxin-like protein